MSGRRRLQPQRRKRRGLILATAAVATMAVVGGVAYEVTRPAAGTDRPLPLAQPADTPTAAPEPAAGPTREKEPEPLTEKPKSEPARGLVYEGLTPAPEGDPCAGVYRTTAGHCTHGPDAPPKGVDIKKDTPPAVKASVPAEDPANDEPERDGAGSEPPGSKPSGTELPRTATPALDATAPKAGGPPSAGSPGSGTGSGTARADGPAGQTVQCDGDGTSGNRVQVVYVHAPGKDRYATYLPSFRKWSADADLIFSESAKDTGGVRHIRYVTGSDCVPTVLNIELPESAMAEFSAMNRALAARGLDRRDRKYMIFADAQVYCGIGTFAGDERPGQSNLSNFGPSYGRTDTGCWGGHTAAHELGHNLGAVNNSAPNTSRGAHCTDEWDVMCYSDSPYYPRMRSICQDGAYENRLDCNHDDYFHTSPRPGSYLATHWNIADNQFLMRNRGTTQPDPTPTPTPTPTGGPTTGPSTAPTVTVGQIAPDSVVATWKAADNAAWYQLFLDGKPLGWVRTTSARVYNLKPGTDYTLAVSVRNTFGRDTGPGRATAFRTAGSGGGATPHTRYLLTNGATGTAAEIWGGRTADGTVLVGSQRNGYAQQQWYVDDAGNGFSRLRSAASGKCLQTGGTAGPGMWVSQQPCAGVAAQQWKLTPSGNGVTITAGSSRYVLGVSNRPYYGSWLIELQHAVAGPAQVWTLQKSA
ncbi:RICIN domain-containing protein [Streptomyces sp. NPDC093595]|uniref:RICIN domain-containing protein n=1 Tax=Streptomyces sp. NPDC093595 TaxID=3366045 RepID=UPI00380A4957